MPSNINDTNYNHLTDYNKLNSQALTKALTICINTNTLKTSDKCTLT